MISIRAIEILHKLYSNTRRYTYRTTPKVIDLGFRLSDVKDLNERAEMEQCQEESRDQSADLWCH